MTGNDILDNALALMFEERQRSPDYVSYAPRILNMLLPETFGVNNQLRRLAGKEPLAAPPVISMLEEEVAYEDDLVRSVLPWGLAAWLLMGDEEGRYPDYLSMYIQQANRATQLIPEQVEDVYAGA